MRNLARAATLLLAAVLTGCGADEEALFEKSHDALRVGMPLSEALAGELADYIEAMGIKNAPGATRVESQPASRDCARYVVDVAYIDGYRVTVYCGINAPSSPKRVPTRKFRDRAELLRALEGDYASWTANLEFRIESPPRAGLGGYAHYRFTTDRHGRIDSVSAVVPAAR